MMNEFPIEARFALCCLATWRLTHLLVAEDGPWNFVTRLRIWLGDSVFGRVMDCFYCLSMWLALPFALAVSGSITGLLVSWLAISGAASLLEQATTRHTGEKHP